jgi:hypothetical protein
MRDLRAGPLTLDLDGADLRGIRLGGREVLRRVYVAVRDRDWGTVAGEVRDLSVTQEGDATAATFECVHRRAGIDFRWQGRIHCSARGVIRFEMQGRAHSTFLRNRIGICVHHPLRETVGRKCTVETAGGRREDVFPFYVSPHQPFLDLRSITHEVEPGVPVEVRFAGDVFEMEDHRNWTDGGFKTYSTPLRLPFPVEVQEGAEVRQAVEIRLLATAESADQAAPDALPQLRPGAGGVRPLPAIGFGIGARFGIGAGLAAEDLPLLRALQPAHLRLDCEIWSDCSEKIRLAAALGLPLELALHISDNGDAEIRAHLDVLRQVRPARVLVFHRNEKVTPSRWVALARSLLGDRAMGGTNQFFAELNRNRPEDRGAGACFSVNPQVHAFDNLSLVENLEAQAHVVQSARMFLGQGPIVVSPVTLLPRFNPEASSQSARPAEPPADPRQRQPFCAAWTAGSLKYLAEAGAASVTYYEVAGPRGLLEQGVPFPVYALFEALAPFAGGQCVPVESSAPLRVLGFAVRKQGRSRVLLVNLSGRVERTTGWLARELGPWEVAVIDNVREVL